MVHNGIEYGDMQLICEAYHLMRDGLKMSAPEMSKIFDKWNHGELDSFLIEITRDILAFNDVDGLPLVEKIRDAAGQVSLVFSTSTHLHPLERNRKVDGRVCVGHGHPSHVDWRGGVLALSLSFEGGARGSQSPPLRSQCRLYR